ncbi:MAG: DUF480 domain-containing protein [Nocardioidaceae bacterium]
MAELPLLDAIDQRVLGSLLEKQRTVPATYPLSLNALRSACNQTSSREPVVDYDDATLEEALTSLRHRDLVRVVWADTGRRTLKYHQLLDERLGLEADERALVTVLLLRGAQAPGELKTRTERLHPFVDREDVEACLRRMAALPTPLVRELERRPGQHDHRWVHLLGPVDTGGAPEPEQTLDLESVLRDGPEARTARVRASYDALAPAYAAEFADELAGLPFERWLLDRVADAAAGHPVADVGCGPGHVSAYLALRGASVRAFDLSPGMVEQARATVPGLDVEVLDLHRLLRPRTDDGWGAVLAWYSLIHLAPSELPAAVGALARVVRPGGWLVLALHAGPGLRHSDEWLGVEVDLDGVWQDPAYVRQVVADAGLSVAEWFLRGPLESRGETTERLYVVAHV